MCSYHNAQQVPDLYTHACCLLFLGLSFSLFLVTLDDMIKKNFFRHQIFLQFTPVDLQNIVEVPDNQDFFLALNLLSRLNLILY